MDANSLAALPPEMVTAVAWDAARDADRVGRFLYHLGLKVTPKRPLPMPKGFLLHLGAALRLLLWEQQGFFFHLEVGLPQAAQAIREAFLSLNNPNADPTEICVAVLRLSLERFAWSGPPELGADVTLDEVQEDALLDNLADYLWAHRSR